MATDHHHNQALLNNPCRHLLCGEESRCNGGGYDGCACGPYTARDQSLMRELAYGTLDQIAPDAFTPRPLAPRRDSRLDPWGTGR